MKPWREVCTPHPDVLAGTFQQSEFAADISAVRAGRAPEAYSDAAKFYERTYITEGMSLLLTQVAQRLNGQGGEPVIQLQTAFGGGKTHTMLAVYHLASRTRDLKDLAGIPGLLDRAGLMDVPRAKVVVLDGTELSPGQAWLHGPTKVQTLWGELAWQLGGEEGLALLREADETGTSPGKETLRDLLSRYAPCVVLVDELVAYFRQFEEGKTLSGGSYGSNLSFVQALTEAVKQVPTAMVLASLPQSDVEAGGARGAEALRSLEHVFGRVQALWRPVATEEAFEIVRRRLFEPITDLAARDGVCRAFAQFYRAEGVRFPSKTLEARYQQRLQQAYPIHPEIFDCLYGDWSTLDGFQRTRGVLKLMAQVIFRLWQDANGDLMILPGSLPLADTRSRDGLAQYLSAGWSAVLERDIDGGSSETMTVDTKEPRFGTVQAARRVARTLFLGSAPSSSNTRVGARGIDRAQILLGCVQPGQSSALFSDALNRLHDRLHYLNSSGDKEQDTTRYWFDTRTNLRREMEDRKGRFEERGEVRSRISDVLRRLIGSSSFDGVHYFTPGGDIPDDGSLRLVFLPPEHGYSRSDRQAASDAVRELVQQHGTRARFRSNRLVFVAADQAGLLRLRDSVRVALAWGSILDDIKEQRLNVDGLQHQKAKNEKDTADGVVQRAARECFKWLLCPMMTPTDREPTIEDYVIPASSRSYGAEIEQICRDNELVIDRWSHLHLEGILRKLYWKEATVSVKAATLWEDMQKYLYLPRLRHRALLEQAIAEGAASRSFATARGQSGESFEGLHLGAPAAPFDDALLLIEPGAATAQLAAQEEQRRVQEARDQDVRGSLPSPDDTDRRGEVSARGLGAGASGSPERKPAPHVVRSFIGTVEVKPAMAKMQLVAIADEIIALLAGDPGATVKVTVEITAEFPAGASPQIQRSVSENARELGFKNKDWEE